MARIRRKLVLYAFISASCLSQTVGCPQLLGNALRDGTRSFFETGLTMVLLNSLNLEELLGLSSGG